MNFYKKLLTIFLIFLISFSQTAVWAVEAEYINEKYPDYSGMYTGFDKYEHYNRKMFKFNLGANKYVIRPIHIIWTSILPSCIIDHIQMVYTNIEYPKRLVSCWIQKDSKHAKSETSRFFINLTLGLAGIFDPADKWFDIKPVNEDMEQALAVKHMKSGHYLILPIFTPTNTRNITGSILDTALNPTSYLFFTGFIISGIKAGLLINRTSRYQPIAQMLESNYVDPYDMSKKLYGLEKYILIANYDRSEIISEVQKKLDEQDKNNIVNVSFKERDIQPDIVLKDYYPIAPVCDSMRTAMFNNPTVYKSCWKETSVWNKSFSKKIKHGKIQVTEGREPYKYEYILQKKKNSPVVILYPSIGEGRTSSHSIYFGKIFFDRGYSVVIVGSPFQWEFVKSMPQDYRPGLPTNDIKYLRKTTSLILTQLEEKNKMQFNQKVVLGTSLGALMTLELANEESKDNTMNITKYIAICPPPDLMYSMKQFDNNSEEWKKYSNDIQERIAFTSAKAAKLLLNKNVSDEDRANIKFSEDEAKLITGYIMHQKMSDVIYEIENTETTDRNQLYKQINNMNYQDYMNKYLISDKSKLEKMQQESNIFYIEDYLKNNNNYKIYHSVDDYLASSEDLKRLKEISQSRMTLMSNGAHLGFMYREEFQNDLIKEIPTVENK